MNPVEDADVRDSNGAKKCGNDPASFSSSRGDHSRALVADKSRQLSKVGAAEFDSNGVMEHQAGSNSS